MLQPHRSSGFLTNLIKRGHTSVAAGTLTCFPLPSAALRDHTRTDLRNSLSPLIYRTSIIGKQSLLPRPNLWFSPPSPSALSQTRSYRALGVKGLRWIMTRRSLPKPPQTLQSPTCALSRRRAPTCALAHIGICDPRLRFCPNLVCPHG